MLFKGLPGRFFSRQVLERSPLSRFNLICLKTGRVIVSHRQQVGVHFKLALRNSAKEFDKRLMDFVGSSYRPVCSVRRLLCLQVERLVTLKKSVHILAVH